MIMDSEDRLVGMDSKITNIYLVEALRRMKADNTPQARGAVIDETVMRAKFLMPVTIRDKAVRFNMVTNSNNQNYFMAFTDWEEMKPCISGPEQKAFIMTFDDYAMLEKKSDKTSGFVINPFTANLIFKKDYILQMYDKKKDMQAEE